MRAKTPKTKDSGQRARVVKRPPRLGEAMKLEGDDDAVLRQIADYYHQRFKATPAAAEYLTKRGLGSAALVDHFRLGYSDRSLSTVLPQKDTRPGREIRERLTRLGVIVDGQERLLGCVVVPVVDEQGTIVNLYGRRISPPASKSRPIHYSLPRLHGPFNEAGLAGSKEVILTPSIIDALTFWCAGFTGVVATADGLTAKLLGAMKRHGTERVLIALRRGASADADAEEIGNELLRAGIVPYRIELPTRMDVNDYARKFQPSERSLALLVKKARPMVDDAPPIEVPATRIEGPLVADKLNVERTEATAAVVAPVDPSARTTATTVEPPAPTTAAPKAKVDGDEVVMVFESRRYRARGLRKNLSYDVLRMNLLVARGEDLYFVDTLDLYSAKQRASFVKQAAAEIAVDEDLVKKDLGRLLMKLEAVQHERIRNTLAPKDEAPKMTPAEHDEAMEFLRDPKLLDRVLVDFDRCGVVGEETNKLVAYLAALSRKLEDPLAVVVQSSSSAGKSSLMEAVLAFVPPEDVVKFSAMTAQSLFYMGETNLQHKVLAIVEEAGAERAAYALKLLQSEGELTIASTGRDAMTGKMVTEAYRVKGPTSLFLTTTRVDLDDELANRAIVLAVSEDREQTRAVHRAQRRRETLEGLLNRRARDRVTRLHQNAQRLLQPIAIINPFAEALTFMDHGPRARRDHAKYLALIRVVALLRQHQKKERTVKHDGEVVEYVEVELADIEIANRLAHEVLGRSIDDLTPQTRALLRHLDQMAREAEAMGVGRGDFRFGRREVQAFTGWSYDALRVHLGRLVERELVVLHNRGRGERHRYVLVFDGKDWAGSASPRLIDVATLRRAAAGGDSDEVGAGLGGGWAPVGVGLVAEAGAANRNEDGALRESVGDEPANATPRRAISGSIGSGSALVRARSRRERVAAPSSTRRASKRWPAPT